MTVSPPEPLPAVSPIPERPRTGSVPAEEQAAFLRPYVPRITVDWLRNTPTARHREVAGSMVFVDISGFTALSERLARKGKVGAELMRDTLDGVFTALLDEAYDWGASLLKWGGDALLLLFDGPDHERRACRAAWEMQAQIARVGRLHVSGGTIVLRMSVGIATGSFHFFMTGSVHRELLVGGPDVTETLTMEGIADATEIGISPRLAAMLDPACVGRSQGRGRPARRPARGRAWPRPDVGEIEGLDIASCIPVAAREHVLLRKTEPEHRTITAAFIDLEDTDALLEELGPLALAEALDERMRTIQEAALRYEVPFYESDVGKGSIKALLTAGAPSSTGHDEERMLRALREIMETPGLIPVRVGVNTGKVFTGDFGPPYRRAYRVFGDAINTAARVMSKAEPARSSPPRSSSPARGRCSRRRRSRRSPQRASPNPFGRPSSDRRPAPRESHQGGIDLLGREAELQTLLEVMDAVRAGQGAIVEVSGGAGHRQDAPRRGADRPLPRFPADPRASARSTRRRRRTTRCARSCAMSSGSRRQQTPTSSRRACERRCTTSTRRSTRGCRCSASCSGSTWRTPPRPPLSRSASCANAWRRSPSGSSWATSSNRRSSWSSRMPTSRRRRDARSAAPPVAGRPRPSPGPRGHAPGRGPGLPRGNGQGTPAVDRRAAAALDRGRSSTSSTRSPRTRRSSPTRPRRSRAAPAGTRCSSSSCSMPSGRRGRSNRSRTRSSR